MLKEDFVQLLCYCYIFSKTKFFKNKTVIVCCDTGTSCECHCLQFCKMYMFGAAYCHRVYENLSGGLGVESLWWTHARSNHGYQSHELFFFCPIGKESRLKQVIIVCTFEHVIAITSVYLKFKEVENCIIYMSSVSILQISRSHLRILGAWRVTWLEYPQILGASVPNLVAMVIWNIEFVHLASQRLEQD